MLKLIGGIIILFYEFSILLVASDAICLSMRHSDPSLKNSFNIKRLFMVMAEYQLDYGYIPYHPLGEEYALYLLKPYLKREKLDIPYPDPNVIDLPVRWNEKEKKVENCDYEYINEPNLKVDLYLHTEYKTTGKVILVEKEKFKKEFVFYVINGMPKGMPLAPHKWCYNDLCIRGIKKSREILGKTYKQIIEEFGEKRERERRKFILWRR